jgi:hypothetical protein
VVGSGETSEGESDQAAEAQTERHAAAGAAATAGAYRGRRFGRGRSQGWSPYASYSSTIDEDLRDNVAAIEVALKENGTLQRDALKQHVNSRRWGPGCFSRALSEAVSAGVVTRVGRNSFALSSEAARHDSVPFVTGDRDTAGRR